MNIEYTISKHIEIVRYSLVYCDGIIYIQAIWDNLQKALITTLWGLI